MFKFIVVTIDGLSIVGKYVNIASDDFNIKMPSYQCKECHFGNNQTRIPYTGKMPSYWIPVLVLNNRM